MKIFLVLMLYPFSLNSISQEQQTSANTNRLDSLQNFKFVDLAFNDETISETKDPIEENIEERSTKLEVNNKPVIITDYEKVKSEYEFNNITRSEKRIAGLILDIRRNSQIEKVAKQIRELYQTTSKEDSIFHRYHDWSSNLKKILENKEEVSKVEICLETLKTSKNILLYKHHMEQVCQQLTVEWLKSKNFAKSLSYTDVNYIISLRPNFFLDQSNGDHLVGYINSLGGEDLKKFLELLTFEISKNNHYPTQTLAKALMKNAAFTQYYNERGSNFISKRKKIRNDFSSKLMKTYATGGDPVADLFYDGVLTEVHQMVNESKVALDEEFAASRMITFSDFLTRNSRQDLARKNLDFVKANYQISELNSILFHFNYLWSYITANDFKSAHKYVKDQDLEDDFQKLDPQLKFWIAYIQKEVKETSKSLKNLKLLVDAHPVSYYGVMSLKLMRTLSQSDYEQFFKARFMKENASYRVPMDYMKLYGNDLKRIQIFADMNTYGLIEAEYKNIHNDLLLNYLPDVEEAKRIDYISGMNHAIGIVVNAGKSYLSTFKLLWGALERKELTVDYFVLRTLFPTPIKDFLTKMTTDIDHVLLYSLIRQESGFFSGAKSPVGAMGLMQLMPYTAKLFDRRISSVQLKSPEKNLNIGMKYLDKLLRKYDNNLVYTLAAYNAGESRVSQWQQGYFRFENILNNVESIPFQETRNYVKLIFRNIYFYKLIIETDVKDSIEFNKLFDMKLGFTK